MYEYINIVREGQGEIIGSEVVGYASKIASSSKRAISTKNQTTFASKPLQSSLNKRLEFIHTRGVKKPFPIPPKKLSDLYLFLHFVYSNI